MGDKKFLEKMLKICKGKLPIVFNIVRARYESPGYCPEGEKLICGRYPSKEYLS